MRIDQLDVVLRARSQWEAMELGTALVRRHAAAIWKPWLLLTLPVFALLNLGGWALDAFWLPGLLLWWLKPAFERIPLYVISRGAFGATPTPSETLRAQLRWGWTGVAACLGWRRLSPARSLLMPVDLLEGAHAAQRRQRRAALGNASYGHASLLTLVCANFELMLQLACIAAVFMFVPLELLPESLQVAWSLIGHDTPAWAWIGFNLVAWAAMSFIGPFYVGAGFGLYLNRRTQLEAWDVEIAFRQLRARLARSAPVLLVLLMACALPGFHAPAQAHTQAGDRPTIDDGAAADAHRNQKNDRGGDAGIGTPQAVFGPQVVDTSGFRQAAARAYEDPALGSSRSVVRWKRKEAEMKETAPPDLGVLAVFAKFIALLGEWILWIVLGIALLALALSARWWLPWLRGSGRKRQRQAESPISQEALLVPEALPPDLLTRARQLWQAGKPRHALALLYRGSVETMSERANLSLPPGATEAQCLRASRRMPLQSDRELFARVVRTWQYAAYAGRMPAEDAFESLLHDLRQQYGWRA
ncbi:MAG: DUF4129 domain-containing protein [Stenotrophomonas sp.]